MRAAIFTLLALVMATAVIAVDDAQAPITTPRKEVISVPGPAKPNSYIVSYNNHLPFTVISPNTLLYLRR